MSESTAVDALLGRDAIYALGIVVDGKKKRELRHGGYTKPIGAQLSTGDEVLMAWIIEMDHAFGESSWKTWAPPSKCNWDQRN